MNKVHVLIGGNMKDRAANLERAVHFLSDRAGEIVAQSAIYETAPWGDADQALFLNQAIILQTMLVPIDLLNVMLEIEQTMGRKRFSKNGPRIIDLDILFYDGLIYRDPRLTIPHPEVRNRRFALVPMVEVDPLLVDPVTGLNMVQLLERCPDKLGVKPFSPDSSDKSGVARADDV